MAVTSESSIGTSNPRRAAATPPRPSATQLAVTQRRVIGSEWIKLRSVRSWTIMAVVAAALMIAFGALAASVASGAVATTGPRPGGGPFAATDPTAISLSGTTLTQLIVGVLGVLFISNEYANGMIRASFAAVPKRLPVLWAKVIVLAGSLVVVMVIATLVAFLLGQGILGADKNTSLGAENVLRAVIGAGLYLAGIGVFGIAVGALMRNTAGAISIVVAALLIVPGLARLVLPDDWNTTLAPYLPSNAGAAFTSVNGSDTLLTAWGGALVFVGWLVVLLIAAAVLIKRRDA